MNRHQDIEIKKIIEGKIFGYEENFFNNLKECIDSGYRPLFTSEITELRSISDKKSPIWSGEAWFCSPSIVVTGRTKFGNEVVVYAHIPNYFCNLENIKKAIKEDLPDGVGYYPEKQFYELIDKEDNENVFVEDYKFLKKYQSHRFFNKILDYKDHPEIIPFFGGVKRAEEYLQQYRKIFEEDIIYVRPHTYKIYDKPCAKFLYFNRDELEIRGFGCDNDGKVVGVPISPIEGYCWKSS